jgi:exodeoxyribonuclease VII small subunit
MSKPTPETSAEATPITFEAGYRRLQEIAEEVNESEVPVDRMADLFAEGKGLDKAMTDHLAAQKARIERIERGQEIQAFRIVARGAGEVRDEATGGALGDAETSADQAPDDDIPF